MKSNLYRVALVGAAGLKGRELNEVLNQRNFPAADVRLLDDDESLGQLEAAGDEASFIQKIRADQFENATACERAGPARHQPERHPAQQEVEGNAHQAVRKAEEPPISGEDRRLARVAAEPAQLLQCQPMAMRDAGPAGGQGDQP